jgi:hypothetical protein
MILQLMKTLKKILAAPFVLLAAVIILLEDWLWDDLARIAALIGRLPLLRSIEAVIVGLPPYAALTLFAIPSLLLIPVKLAALYFIAHGKATLGLITVVGAKVAGTALIARIFTLTCPQLRCIGWFAWLHDRVVAFKARVYGAIKSTAIYKVVHMQHLRLRAAIAERLNRGGFWTRRWRAAMKVSRRKRVIPE